MLTGVASAGELRYELVTTVTPANASPTTVGDGTLVEINGSFVAVGYYDSVTSGVVVRRPLLWSLSGSYGFPPGAGTDVSLLGPFLIAALDGGA
jgi:hypothetical protein